MVWGTHQRQYQSFLLIVLLIVVEHQFLVPHMLVASWEEDYEEGNSRQ